MSANRDAQRIDALLASALVFGESLDARREETDEAEDAARVGRALALLAGLSAAERLAAQSRADWFRRLAPQKQREWLAHVLGGARRRTEDRARLDEHVHPSHVVAALENEPPVIRALIIKQLPSSLAEAVAQTFGDDNETQAVVASPEVVAVVRRAFLANFTEAAELATPTPLDLLSGVELARLIRLLGVRETAVACRAIASREAMAAFLRRFVAEDARAITAHIGTLSEVEPRRIEFAGEVLHEALSAEPEMGAMLDRVGLRLLAFVFITRDAAHLSYAAQKLPRAAASLLRQLVENARSGLASSTGIEDARAVMRAIADEAESLAAEMRRRAARRSAE